MGLRARRRRQAEAENRFRGHILGGAGEGFITPSSGTLPRAQERVQQAIEQYSLLDAELPRSRRSGVQAGMGRSPISADRRGPEYWSDRLIEVRSARPRVSVSYGPKARLELRPYRRISSRRYAYRQLQRLQISSPRRVLFCARRAIRREVLFALGVGGRKGSAPGSRGGYRRNANSQWSC